MPPVNLLFSLAFILTSLLLVLGLTEVVRRMLVKRALLDIPNDRSSHKVPVPRGGGWALLVVLLPALVGAAVFIDQDLQHFSLICAVIMLAGISWLDDRFNVSPLMRLTLHVLATCLGSLSFSPQEVLFGGDVPYWLDRAVMIFGWAWFINLYNFMDGIDGITGVETIAIATGLCFVMDMTGNYLPFVDFITLILTGTCLGFLAHNWHPAKIFLGDVGSVPLGYLTGFCLLSLAVKGHLIPALILPLYYLADSGLTITKRALRGEKIWQAHREHFYQKATLGKGRHDKVVVWIAIANAGLIAASIIAVFLPWEGLGLGILIVAVLLQKMHKTGANYRLK